MSDLKKTNLDTQMEAIRNYSQNAANGIKDLGESAVRDLEQVARVRKELPGIDLLERARIATVTDVEAHNTGENPFYARVDFGGYHHQIATDNKGLPRGKYRVLLFVLPLEG